MISHEHGVAFMHIRKAAGTTVKRAFDCPRPWDAYLQDGLLDRDWPEFAQSRARYTLFTVVRNPWDRFVSAWRYLERTRHHPIEHVLANLPQQDGDRDERHAYRHMTRLQCDLFVDEHGRWVTDRVLRFENLQADFDELCRDLGLEPIPLEHHMRNPSRPQGDHYRRHFRSRESRELFMAGFGRDVEQLGYEF